MNPLNLDPIIFSIGPLQVRWYGLMYVVGFIVGTQLLLKLSKEKYLPLKPKQVDLFVFFIFIGLFLGARIFYIFIYNWDTYANNPAEVFAVWKGGLSFHGGLLGFICVIFFYSYKFNIQFFRITDSIVLAAPQGIFFGRMGNFINGELYGRVTDVPWGMVFKEGGPYPRHPSQLYEGLSEGLLIFALLWILKRRVTTPGILSGIFLICYGVFRYIAEFFREPDAQLGYYFGGTTTMGQILCFLMILFGIIVCFISVKKNRKKFLRN